MKKTSNLVFVFGSLLAVIIWSSALWLYGCGNVITVTAEASAPVIISVLPNNGSTDIVLNSTVVATLNNDIASSSVTNASLTLTSSAGTAVAGTVVASATSIKFTPAASLEINTTYFATLAATVASTSGKTLGNAYTWSFTTGAVADTTAPTITAVSPASGAASIAVTSPVTATFDKAMDPSTITTASFTLTSTTQAVTGSVSYDATNKQAVFTPAVNLGNSITYTATIDATVKDLSGNALAAATTWSFTTVAATGGGTDCNTVSLPANVTGGCNISLVTPAKCEEIDLSGGKSYQFAWTTGGTYCETPYFLYISNDPTTVTFQRQMSESIGSITKTGGGYTYITAQNLIDAGISPVNGLYHFVVAGWYGSHPDSRVFKIKF